MYLPLSIRPCTSSLESTRGAAPFVAAGAPMAARGAADERGGAGEEGAIQQERGDDRRWRTALSSCWCEEPPGGAPAAMYSSAGRSLWRGLLQGGVQKRGAVAAAPRCRGRRLQPMHRLPLPVLLIRRCLPNCNPLMITLPLAMSGGGRAWCPASFPPRSRCLPAWPHDFLLRRPCILHPCRPARPHAHVLPGQGSGHAPNPRARRHGVIGE